MAKRKLVPVQRPVAVDVDLLEELAEVGHEPRVAHGFEFRVVALGRRAVGVTVRAFAWHVEQAALHDVAELGQLQAVDAAAELRAQRLDLLRVEAHHDLAHEAAVLLVVKVHELAVLDGVLVGALVEHRRVVVVVLGVDAQGAQRRARLLEVRLGRHVRVLRSRAGHRGFGSRKTKRSRVNDGFLTTP